MKTLLASTLLSLITAGTALAQSAEPVAPPPPPPPAPAQLQLQPVADAAPLAPAAAQQPAAVSEDDDTGWHRPAGQRFTSGFRLGYMHIANYAALNRATSDMNPDGTVKMTSIKEKFGLKSPDMFVIGYEGFYRIVGHSWLNVLMVGNVSVAGLDQSKFIPSANGLLGFEIDRQVELGVGVNLVPDPDAPSHMIMAAGWTPKVGSIQTPIHAFFIPDSEGTDPNTGKQLASNWRAGATIGMNW